MIIVFLKYASTRKVHEPTKVKEVEKPTATETATDTRLIQDTGILIEPPSAEAHLGESLG